MLEFGNSMFEPQIPELLPAEFKLWFGNSMFEPGV